MSNAGMAPVPPETDVPQDIIEYGDNLAGVMFAERLMSELDIIVDHRPFRVRANPQTLDVRVLCRCRLQGLVDDWLTHAIDASR